MCAQNIGEMNQNSKEIELLESITVLHKVWSQHAKGERGAVDVHAGRPMYFVDDGAPAAYSSIP